MREPSYLALFRSGVLAERIAAARRLLERCELCPRRCGVNRLAGEEGFCRTGAQARVASFHAHFGEEAPLVGTGGSGTIFLSSCNLRCIFCQNFDISHGNEGDDVSADRLAAMMVRLRERGCHNINFVTPTHVVPQIIEALPAAIAGGLDIPLVYNCGGYELTSILRLWDGIFDIYMPDFKFWDDTWSTRLCDAPDYRYHAAAAVREMHRQVGDLALDETGTACRGLIVRHLVMPNGVAGTDEIVRFLADEISRDTYVNIMAQYRPLGLARWEPLIARGINREEYAAARRSAERAGLRRLD